MQVCYGMVLLVSASAVSGRHEWDEWWATEPTEKKKSGKERGRQEGRVLRVVEERVSLFLFLSLSLEDKEE